MTKSNTIHYNKKIKPSFTWVIQIKKQLYVCMHTKQKLCISILQRSQVKEFKKFLKPWNFCIFGLRICRNVENFTKKWEGKVSKWTSHNWISSIHHPTNMTKLRGIVSFFAQEMEDAISSQGQG